MSPTQLERWRQHGLLARSRVVRRGWGGSEVAGHPEAVLEAAYVLAQVSSRGRPWQRGGVILFERGYMLTTPCLRDCATWLAVSLRKRLSRSWEEASAQIGAAPRSAEEELEDLAHLAATLSRRHRATRGLLKSVRDELDASGSFTSKTDLDDAAHRALAMRLIDIMGAGSLSAELIREARYGVQDAPSPGRRMPIPRDRNACIETLTRREAYAVRAHLLTLNEAGLRQLAPGQALLDAVVWDVATARINVGDNADAWETLSAGFLDDLEEETGVLRAELDGDGVVGQLDLLEYAEEQSGGGRQTTKGTPPRRPDPAE